MPSASTLWIYAGASLALLLIPGPAVLFIVARSSAHGRRAGLVSIAGVHTATLVHVLGAVAGLSAVLVASSLAFSAVKIVGGLYLLYLGGRSLWAARRQGRGGPPARQRPTGPPGRLYREGFVVNLLNPKVALFFLAFLPQFVEGGRGPVWLQTLTLGLTYIAIGLCTDSLYALVGAKVGAVASGRAARLRGTRYFEGSVLIGMGALTLALPHRRSPT